MNNALSYTTNVYITVTNGQVLSTVDLVVPTNTKFANTAVKLTSVCFQLIL